MALTRRSGRFVLFMCGLVSAFTSAGCRGAEIEQVLPFTPSADSVRIETKLIDSSPDTKLTGTLTPANDKKSVVWSGELTAPATTLSDLPVRAWDPGNPNLYDLTVTAKEAGKRTKHKTVRFGFRQVESKNGNVYLNGKPIFLRGLAINPPGRTVPDEVGQSRKFAYDYVKYLRGQGVNLLRMEVDDPTWLDVCDELGMMVYQGFYGSPPTGMSKAEEAAQKALATQDEAAGKRLPRDFERSAAAYQSEFETYVRHPSVIIYVLSNEMPYKGDTGEEVHQFLTKIYDRLSKWDRTRLYIGNAGYGEGRQGDINDVHRYWGWYYNSFTTYYNLRDGKLFGDPAKDQPFTFSECVGSFTGPTGAWNSIERKQLAAGLGWTGHAPPDQQPAEAQAYQRFMNKQAIEIFRRMRAVNPRVSGLMPFTITFHNWRGIKSFDQMKPTAASKQFGTSYHDVLLSFEHWQPNVYAGATTPVYVHVVNDSDDFKDLSDTLLEWKLIRADDQSLAASGQVEIPPVKYYDAFRQLVEVKPSRDAKAGEYRLVGQLKRRGETVSTNETPIFVAPQQWAQPLGTMKRQVAVIGDATAKALTNLGVSTRIADVAKLDSTRDVLVIGESAWDEKLAATKEQLKSFVAAGGRVICLGQPADKFDASWLPSEVKLFTTSVNDPAYMTADRPAADQTHVNPERPDHPVFAGIGRHQLRLWSDYTDWDETKEKFPRISPMRFGYTLAKQDNLKHTAVLANYDQALQGVALAEMFGGKGSVLFSGFDIIGRSGRDPVADRMLANMVAYMAGDAPHDVHPRIDSPIRWGDYASERGVFPGPLSGFFYHTEWQQPPTDRKAEPTDKNTGWNTRPSDQFLPAGVRPRGPYHYTFNCSPRDAEPKKPDGTGVFYATIPAGKSRVVTRLKNPTTQAAAIRVDVNDGRGQTITIPIKKEMTIETPITGGATVVGVRYTGGKELVILETSFR